MITRSIKQDDLDKLVNIEMHSSYIWGMRKEKFRNHLERILLLRSIIGYILEIGKKGIGYFIMAIKSRSAHLNYFAIIKPYQNKGLSNIMMKKLISVAKSKRCKEIELTVWAKNYRAIGLYNKYGFYVTNIKRKYYDNGDDKIRMRLDLK